MACIGLGEGDMAEQFLPVLITIGAAAFIAVAILALAAIVGQRSRQETTAKREIYETGVPVLDRAHKRISVKFYLVALVFVVLDVEVAFLYPWAVTYREMLAEHSVVILWDMLAFMALLAVAYAWLWKTGVFDWGRREASRGERRLMAPSTTAPLAVVPADQLVEVGFDAEMESAIDDILSRYPTTSAALLPVLWLCQDRWGWISPAVTRAIGDRLDLSPAFIEGVTSFYTMYRRTPPGRYLLQVCTTLSCQLCGAGELVTHLKHKLGIDFGETTADGRFTLVDVQCLGACGEAPIIQINNDYRDGLDVDALDALLDGLE